MPSDHKRLFDMLERAVIRSELMKIHTEEDSVFCNCTKTSVMFERAVKELSAAAKKEDACLVTLFAENMIRAQIAYTILHNIPNLWLDERIEVFKSTSDDLMRTAAIEIAEIVAND